MSVSFIAIFVFVFIITAFHAQAKLCCQALVNLLTEIRAGGESGFGSLRGSLRTWAEQEQCPPPLPSVLGCIILIAACAAEFAHFVVIHKRVELIFPAGDRSDVLAFTFVILGAVIGIACHAIRGRAVRVILIFLAVLIIGFEGTLSYVHVAVSERANQPSIEVAVPASDDGSLFINKGDPALGSADPLNAEQIAPLRREEPGQWPLSRDALLAAAGAVLFAAAGMFGFWAALKLGEAAVVRLLIAPLRLPFALLHWAFQHLKIDSVLSAIADGVLDACGILKRFIISLTQKSKTLFVGLMKKAFAYYSRQQRFQRAKEKRERRHQLAEADQEHEFQARSNAMQWESIMRCQEHFQRAIEEKFAQALAKEAENESVPLPVTPANELTPQAVSSLFKSLRDGFAGRMKVLAENATSPNTGGSL